jgi:hypothetical protein
MEDMRSSMKSFVERPTSLVVRQFAGSRVERQVLAQAFDVVWGVLGSPISSGDDCCRDLQVSSSRGEPLVMTEGVVS